MPSRLLGSGIFQVLGGFTISPVIDLHSGFRYSNVDVLNEYSGRPNSQRFPAYFSLDMKVYRDFKIPSIGSFPKGYRLRVGQRHADRLCPVRGCSSAPPPALSTGELPAAHGSLPRNVDPGPYILRADEPGPTSPGLWQVMCTFGRRYDADCSVDPGRESHGRAAYSIETTTCENGRHSPAFTVT